MSTGRLDFEPIARFARVFEDRYSVSACTAILLVLFAAPLFFDLGRGDLGNDEAIYVHASKSIVHENAWLSPWSSPGSSPFLEKPPLKFWIVAAGIRWLGLPDDELGYRLWDPIFSTCAFLYLFALGRAAAGPICGLATVAALFLSESLLFVHGVRSHNMEASLLLAYCGGIWHWYRWMTSEDRVRAWHLLAFSLWGVFAFLCKFVAAAFLPLCAASTLLLPSVRHRFWQSRRLIGLSITLCLALSSPWFIYQHLQRGMVFWQEILGVHVVQRFSTHLDPSHVQSAGFYWRALQAELQEAGTWGWTCAGAILWVAITLRHRSTFGVLILIWAVLPLALISAGSSKLFHYAYPFLPPYALFAGFALTQVTQAVCAGWASTRLGTHSLGFVHLRKLLIVPALIALAYATYVQSFGPGMGSNRACSSRVHHASLGAAALLIPVPGIGPPLAVGASLLWGLSKPASRWCALVERTRQDPIVRRVLADCVLRLEANDKVPKIYLHTYRSFIPNHVDPYYYRRAGGFQQNIRPQPFLLFFRLWVPEQQALSVVEDRLWTHFLELRSTPELHAEIEQVASRIEMESEVATLIDQLESLEPPPGIRISPQSRIYLPGPFEACLQPLLEAGAIPLPTRPNAPPLGTPPMTVPSMR